MYVDHRLIKIIDEILVFFYDYSSRNIKIEINKEKEYSQIDFEAKLGVPIEQKKLQRLEKLLSAPRQHEMEEYYWGLTGNDTTPSCELALVGMMIDWHETVYDEQEQILRLKICRNRI